MVDFTSKRFSSTNTIIPSMPDLPERAGNPADAAKAFLETALQLDKIDQEEDTVRGNIAGQNSVEIGPNGEVIRKEMPLNITTRAGAARFQAEQRLAAFNARKSAIINKNNELRIKYANDPDGSLKLAREMDAFTSAFVDAAHPDIKGRLALEGVSQTRDAVSALAQGEQQRAHTSNVKVNDGLINKALSDVGELARNGKSSLLKEKIIHEDIQDGLEAGLITPNEAANYYQNLKISKITGQLWAEAMAKTGTGKAGSLSDLVAVRNDVFKRLYSGDEYEVNAYDPKTKKLVKTKVDLDDTERQTIMNSVKTFINEQIEQRNLQAGADNEILAAEIAPVKRMLLANPNLTKERLDEEFLKNGWLGRINTNPTIRAAYDSIFERIGPLEAGRIKARNADTNADMLIEIGEMTTIEETAEYVDKISYFRVIDRGFAGSPEREVTMRNKLTAKQVEIIKRDNEVIDSGTEAYFNDLATRGGLSLPLIQKLSVEKDANGNYTPMATWVLRNKDKLQGYVRDADNAGGYSSSGIKEAQAQQAKGFPNTEKSVTQLSLLMSATSARAISMGLEDPFDPNTPEGVLAMELMANDNGVINKPLLNYLSKRAWSGDVNSAWEARQSWDRINNSIQKDAIRETMPEKLKNRLSFLEDNLDVTNSTDQAEFSKRIRKDEDQKASDKKLYPPDTPKVFREKINELMEEAGARASGMDNFAHSMLGTYSFLSTNKDWRFILDIFKYDSPGFVEKFARLGRSGFNTYHGNTFFDQEFADIGVQTADAIQVIYQRERSNYNIGEKGDRLALEEALQILHAKSGLGITRYSPEYRHGEQSENTISLHAIEAHFPGDADDLVAVEVNRALREISVDGRGPFRKDNMGQILGIDYQKGSLGWFRPANIDDLPPTEVNWLRDLIGNPSLLKDGWITLVPIEHESGPGKPVYEVYIQRPDTDPDSKSRNNKIILNRRWEPSLNDLAENRQKIFQEEERPLGKLGTKVVGKTSEGRDVYENQDGSVSSERTTTIQNKNGKWINPPTIYGGKEVSPQKALRIIAKAGGKDPETNRDLKEFNTKGEAIAAARHKSANIKIDYNGQ